VPEPCPEAGDSPESQSADAVASQGHSGAVVTASVPVPPSAAMFWDDIANVTWHLTGVGVVATAELEPHPAMRASTRLAIPGNSRWRPAQRAR